HATRSSTAPGSSSSCPTRPPNPPLTEPRNPHDSRGEQHVTEICQTPLYNRENISKRLIFASPHVSARAPGRPRRASSRSRRWNCPPVIRLRKRSSAVETHAAGAAEVLARCAGYDIRDGLAVSIEPQAVSGVQATVAR